MLVCLCISFLILCVVTYEIFPRLSSYFSQEHLPLQQVFFSSANRQQMCITKHESKYQTVMANSKLQQIHNCYFRCKRTLVHFIGKQLRDIQSCNYNNCITMCVSQVHELRASSFMSLVGRFLPPVKRSSATDLLAPLRQHPQEDLFSMGRSISSASLRRRRTTGA
jgi:hypothetical protein